MCKNFCVPDCAWKEELSLRCACNGFLGPCRSMLPQLHTTNGVFSLPKRLLLAIEPRTMEALKKPTTSLGLHGRIIGVCGVALAVACEGCKKKPELCWVPSTPYTEPFKGSREAPEICRRPSKVRVSTRGIYGSFNEYCSGRHCLTTLSSRNTRQIRASPRNLQRAHSFRLPATSIDGLWGTTSTAFAVTSFASMASTRAAACPTDTRGPAFTDSPNSSANSSADLSSSEGSSSNGNVRSTTSNKTKRNKSGGSSCSSSFAQGPLNIVSTAEEGDILRGLKVQRQSVKCRV